MNEREKRLATGFGFLGVLISAFLFYIWSNREPGVAEVSKRPVEEIKSVDPAANAEQPDGRELVPDESEPMPMPAVDSEEAPTPVIEGLEPVPATPVPQIGPPMPVPQPVE